MKPYYFIENKYPANDPKTDLDFESDVTYGQIIGDELDKYQTPYVIDPATKPLKKVPRRKKQPTKSNNSWVQFIVFVIVLVVAHYLYNRKSRPVVGAPRITADLVVSSPYYGGAAAHMIAR